MRRALAVIVAVALASPAVASACAGTPAHEPAPDPAPAPMVAPVAPPTPTTAPVAPSASLASTVTTPAPPPSDPSTTTTPPVPAVPASATITLVAVGDLMCHADQFRKAYASGAYDFRPSFAPVRSTVSAADLAIGNLETTLRRSGFSGYPAFRTPTQYAYALRYAGFDVLGTANNHSLDGGATGVRFTSWYLSWLRLGHTGTDLDPPVVRNVRGVRVGVLAYTYGTNGIRSPYPGAVNRINTWVMRRDIRRLRPYVDLVVVCVHVGTEYSMTPETKTRSLAHYLVDNGADLVLGSHPHVVRPVERYRGRYIVYSLGNAISGQSKRNTDFGIMVRATVHKEAGLTRVVRFQVAPVYRDRTSGAGRRTYRMVMVDRALAGRESLISSADRYRLRQIRYLCRRIYPYYYR